MLCTVVRQRRRNEVRTRLIRRRHADAVVIDRVAEENKEIGPLRANRVEDGIPRLTLPALILPAEVTAPGERRRGRDGRLRQRGEFTLRGDTLPRRLLSSSIAD